MLEYGYEYESEFSLKSEFSISLTNDIRNTRANIIEQKQVNICIIIVEEHP